MRVLTAIAAAALVGSLALSAVPWAALVERVNVPEPWDGPVQRVVVEQGQTFWQLARLYHPHRDPQQVVDWIRSLNGGIDPGRIRPGQVFLVPMELEVAEATP